jgi:hypothetical protein
MFQKILFALLIITNLTYAQQNFKSYIPPGDTLRTLVRGDLNKDSIDDIVIVTESGKNDHQTETPRTLIILFGQPDGTYRFHTKSLTAVFPVNKYHWCFFTDATIKKGILTLEHEYLNGGGCLHLYRYQNGGFYLIGASTNEGGQDYSASLEYNLSTGKYISSYHNYETGKTTSNTGTQKPQRLPRIEKYELFTLKVNNRDL